MARSRRLTGFEEVTTFLSGMGGEHAPKLVQIYERKNQPIKDEEMAGKMDLKVTDIRTILNRLHYRGIANYNKKRNKKTGWYSYTWTIDKKRILALLIEQQLEEIEKLEQKKETEENYSYFLCKRECHEFPFEVAAEYQFRCPQCGSELNSLDNVKRTKQMKEKIEKKRKTIKDLGAVEN